MSKSTQSKKLTYKKAKKETELGRIKEDLSNKLKDVRKDPIPDARDYGVRELTPHTEDVSAMQRSLKSWGYYLTLPRDPSTADVVELQRSVTKTYRQYQTRSQELAKEQEEAQEKAANDMKYWAGRKIVERFGTPSPAPTLDYPSLREAPSSAPLEVVITEASFRREPTPQPVLAALPPPPMYRGSTSRRIVGPQGMHVELPVSSSSRHTHSVSMSAVVQHRGHRRMDSNFSAEMSEEYDVISEESEHSSS